MDNMIQINNPGSVICVTINDRVWYVAPGTLTVTGDVVRFRLNRTNRVMTTYLDEITAVIEETV